MSRINRADEQRMEEARQSLAKFVCSERVQPRAFCDKNVLFMQYSHSLNPNFHCSFESLERNCLIICAGKREKAMNVFSKLDGCVSVSVDLLVHEEPWAESIDEYICLSAHFIDNDWKLQKWVIKYCDLFVDNELPNETILKSLKEWDIEGKVFTITDGGTSDMVEVIKEDIQGRRKLPLDGQLFHVKCSGDIISRMVEEGYEEIREIIDEVEELAWSKSEPVWYLTSSKLREALKLEALGEFSSESVKKDYDLPSEEEWGKVRSMCRIVDRIHNIVEGLFKVKRPTANLFLPHLQEIHDYLTQECGSSDEFVKAVAQKMLETFDEYWKDMYLVLAIAALMDPRYKMKYLEFCSSMPDGGEGDSKATVVLQTIRKLYDDYVTHNCQKEYLLSDSSSEDEEEYEDKNSEVKCIKIMDRLNILRKYGLSLQSYDQPHKSDLDLYLEEPVFQWSENFSVLAWWKDNCSRYPHLSRMARDFLAIPMSVATSYEAYYTEQRQADITLLSLKPELMNALKCTRSWKLG